MTASLSSLPFEIQVHIAVACLGFEGGGCWYMRAKRARNFGHAHYSPKSSKFAYTRKKRAAIELASQMVEYSEVSVSLSLLLAVLDRK